MPSSQSSPCHQDPSNHGLDLGSNRTCHLAGGNPVFRACLEAMLEATVSAGALPVNIAGSPQSIVLLIVDDWQKFESSMASIRQCYPDAPVLVLASTASQAHCNKAKRLGAAGLIETSASSAKFVQTVAAILRGESAFSAGDKPETPDPKPKLPDGVHLTQQDRAILVKLARGCSNSQIASSLAIPAPRARGGVRAVLRKLGMQNRTQAALWAANHGMAGGNPSSFANR
jgi:DNA-binding NarL/FixJ family response regulator